ncbi:hypothetical protein [Massilia varians]|nr:hypothetical protein [Massilia varians]MDK6079682.1 hypothetical protein [Massilia varians]
MIPFRVTVATESGPLTFFTISPSSYQAWLDAANRYQQPRPISVVRV